MSERRLVLLRHAKAEPPSTMDDLDRPLTAQGHADSAAAGAWLAQARYLPDLVICSPAKRARQTWHGAALGMVEPPVRTSETPVAELPGWAPVVQYQSGVYRGTAQDLLSLIRAASEVTTILLVGHNPAVSQLSLLLDPDAGRDSNGLATSGLAVHEVTGEWSNLVAGAAPLTAWHTARAE